MIPHTTIYEISIHSWSSNIIIKADRDMCQEKREIRPTGNLSKKKKKVDRTCNPLYYLQIGINFPINIPSSLPPTLFVLCSVCTLLHPPKPHIRAIKAQNPDPSRQDIPARVGIILSFTSFPCTPAYRVVIGAVQDITPAHYCHGALLPTSLV